MHRIQQRPFSNVWWAIVCDRAERELRSKTYFGAAPMPSDNEWDRAYRRYTYAVRRWQASASRAWVRDVTDPHWQGGTP